MMTFEEFRDNILVIKRFEDGRRVFEDCLAKMASGSTTPVIELGNELCSRFIFNLEHQFPNCDSEWISYFIYECEFGEKKMEVQIDKIEYIMSLEVLYKILTEKN